MDERRLEIRMILDAVPESLKNAVIRYPGIKAISSNTVDINSVGMAFISKDRLDRELEIGKLVTISFDSWNTDVKGYIVYSYPIADERLRIGVLFKNDKSIRQYYKILKDASQS
jgi:hypothetical protein